MKTGAELAVRELNRNCSRMQGLWKSKLCFFYAHGHPKEDASKAGGYNRVGEKNLPLLDFLE